MKIENIKLTHITFIYINGLIIIIRDDLCKKYMILGLLYGKES
jgi:hypothetical protein